MKTEKIELPKELYQSWLENETNTIEAMDATQIEGRIRELEQLIFESKTRLSITYQKRIKLMGADWADNSRAISAPDFRVNYDKDQRARTPTVKKTKEEKHADKMEAAGIDPNILKELIKKKMAERASKPMVLPVKPVPVVQPTSEVKEPKAPVSKTAIAPMLIDDGDFD